MIMISYTSPWFLIAIVPICTSDSILTFFHSFLISVLVTVYYYVQKFFRATSRELGRLCSITNSPIFAHYTETLLGLQAIRAFDAQSDLALENVGLINNNSRAYLIAAMCFRWLGIRVEIVGALVALTVGMDTLMPTLVLIFVIILILILILIRKFVIRITFSVEVRSHFPSLACTPAISLPSSHLICHHVASSSFHHIYNFKKSHTSYDSLTKPYCLPPCLHLSYYLSPS